MVTILKPHSTLLTKLGCIAHHSLLLTGTNRDQHHLGELSKLRNDPEVLQWLTGMERLNLLPREV